MFDTQNLQAIGAEARRIGVEPEALRAVVEVESNGQLVAIVGGRKEPLIRFEGHYFYRRLTGDKRARAVREKLAHAKAGGVKNPKDQAGRWRLLARAMEIDAQAALESISIGFGQVMGAHWELLGYASVTEMVNRARSGMAGQLDLMVRYIEKMDLAGTLRRRDWAAFARGYNGRNFAQAGYHVKIANAYQRLMAGQARPAAPSARGMLRLGSNGEGVRDLQRLLLRAGHAVTADGDYGRATHQAVSAFQAANGLEADGVAGPQTLKALDRYRQGLADRPGVVPASEIRQVRDGVGVAVGGGGGLEVARQTVVDAGYQLSAVPALEWLSTLLAITAVALALGGLVYAARGWLTSGQTVEAPDEEQWAADEPVGMLAA